MGIRVSFPYLGKEGDVPVSGRTVVDEPRVGELGGTPCHGTIHQLDGTGIVPDAVRLVRTALCLGQTERGDRTG